MGGRLHIRAAHEFALICAVGATTAAKNQNGWQIGLCQRQ